MPTSKYCSGWKTEWIARKAYSGHQLTSAGRLKWVTTVVAKGGYSCYVSEWWWARRESDKSVDWFIVELRAFSHVVFWRSKLRAQCSHRFQTRIMQSWWLETHSLFSSHRFLDHIAWQGFEILPLENSRIFVSQISDGIFGSSSWIRSEWYPISWC